MNKMLFGVIVIVIILGGGYALMQRSAAPADQTPSTAQQPAPTPEQVPAETSAQAGTSLTSAAVAAHASASDCWTIVSGKVYDVTGVITSHPGGSKPILEVCGKDGTSEFMEMNGKAQANAQNQLSSLYKGDLAQ